MFTAVKTVLMCAGLKKLLSRRLTLWSSPQYSSARQSHNLCSDVELLYAVYSHPGGVGQAIIAESAV